MTDDYLVVLRHRYDYEIIDLHNITLTTSISQVVLVGKAVTIIVLYVI